MEEIKAIRVEMKEIYDKITNKKGEVYSNYLDYAEKNKRNNFFGMDSLHFQNKLIDIEYESITKQYHFIDNRMYCDYYKLFGLITQFLKKNYSDNFDNLLKNKHYPVYKDLEQNKVYDFNTMNDIHHDIIVLIKHLYEKVKNVKNEIENDKQKMFGGLKIANYVYNFIFSNTVTETNVKLFEEYLDSYHVDHTNVLNNLKETFLLMLDHLDPPKPNPPNSTDDSFINVQNDVEVEDIDVQEPIVVLDEPVEVVNPITEPAELVEPVIKPIVEQVIEPIVEQVIELIVEQVDPIMEQVIEQVEPVIEPIVEQVIEPVDPIVEQVIEPIVEQVEPIVEPVIEPIVEQVDPIVEPVEPIVEQVEPIVEHVDPIVEQVDPIVEHVDPIVEQVDPIADPVEAEEVKSVDEDNPFVEVVDNIFPESIENESFPEPFEEKIQDILHNFKIINIIDYIKESTPLDVRNHIINSVKGMNEIENTQFIANDPIVEQVIENGNPVAEVDPVIDKVIKNVDTVESVQPTPESKILKNPSELIIQSKQNKKNKKKR